MSSNDPNGAKRNTWKLFSIAVVFALLAGLSAVIYLKVLEHRLEKRLSPAEQQMTSAIVANKNLAVGSKIDTSTVAVRKIPSQYVNSDVLTPAQFDSVEGAILTKPLEQGKMLTSDYFERNIPKDFSDTIKIGHRAITIQVGEINSISGLIRPGNYIDLYSRLQGGGAPALGSDADDEVVIPVLEDVFVLATDRHSARPNEDEFLHLQNENRRRAYDTLTLEVTPKDAALITLAESRGSLVAVLRNTQDTEGILFRKMGFSDLISHSGEMLQQAQSKLHNKSLNGIHADAKGRLVTKDGTIVKDPNVHLNKEGLVVTKDGTVLSGRGLSVGKDGKIRTRNGKTVDTKTVHAGKNGTLVDKNGTVVGSNGYQSAKGGFLVDNDGNIRTHDGKILHGLHIGKDGKVRTPDGKVIHADDIEVGPDGKVSLKSGTSSALSVDKDGNVRDSNGKKVGARSLVNVDKDGVVTTKDGKVLKGVHVGEDGQLYSADGKKMSSGDVLLASKGVTAGKNGTVIDKNGHVLNAADLTDVGADGKVRDKDGKVLAGVYQDADGTLRNKDGSKLTAQDVVKQGQLAKKAFHTKTALKGVTAQYDPDFAASIHNRSPRRAGPESLPYEVEYIIGGSSDGAASTFMVQVEELKKYEETE